MKAAKVREAEQFYNLEQVGRIVGLQPERLSALAMAGKFPPAAVIIPGGGHRARRWTASQIAGLVHAWANPLAASNR